MVRWCGIYNIWRECVWWVYGWWARFWRYCLGMVIWWAEEARL